MTESENCFLRLPNDWIDRAMPTMSPSEWMIMSVVLRQTIGWHKDNDAISLSQFQSKTGLSRHTVITALRRLEEMGWIRAYEIGTRSVYEPHLEGGAKNAPSAGGAEIAPKLVQKMHRHGAKNAPEVVQKLHTQKKQKKLTKEKEKKTYIASDVDWFADESSNQAVEDHVHSIADVAESAKAKSARKAKRQLDDHEHQRHKELFSGIARICVLDVKIRSCAGQVSRAAKELRNADASATGQTMSDFLEWWKISDWRGKMGKPPTVNQVIQCWKLFRENYAENPKLPIDKREQSVQHISRVSRVYSNMFSAEENNNGQ